MAVPHQSGYSPREGIHDIEMRFLIAQDGGKPDELELHTQRQLREKIADAAFYLNANVEDGREKSLALTKLEEALMWAGKAIFA